MKRIDILKLVFSLIICLDAGWIGSFFTAPSIPTWYAALEKPFFNPPNWLFAPVWTILYILMGISVFIIWRKGLKEPQVKPAILIFLIQLILNTLWSIVFFGWHSPLAGVIVIVFLWILILVTILKFWRLSRAAGILLLPYILWVSFASVLNISLWLLNR